MANPNNSNLETQAKEFAGRISDLLNQTVCNGVRMSAVARSNAMIVGCGLTNKQLQPARIPVCTTKAKPRVWLWLMYGLTFDHQGFLTSQRSSFSVFRSPGDDEEPAISFDYIRDPANKYQPAHIHVYGTMPGLADMVGRPDRNEVQLVDLHLPVGGKRFRPGLEDLVEFLVLEGHGRAA